MLVDRNRCQKERKYCYRSIPITKWNKIHPIYNAMDLSFIFFTVSANLKLGSVNIGKFFIFGERL